MVTAWSPWRTVRTRWSAGSLPRMLGLAVLLFGVLVTHGAHADSVRGHLSISAMAPAAFSDGDLRHAAVGSAQPSAAEADGHHGGHEPSHPGEQCVSGQPQQGSAPVPPCFAASLRQSAGADDASTGRGPAPGGPVEGAPAAALRAASVVQQV